MVERKKLLLRLDPQVYEAMARWAGDDLRSVNAQIEYALRLALRGAGRPPRAARLPGEPPAPEPAAEPAAEPGLESAPEPALESGPEPALERGPVLGTEPGPGGG
jgi:hypothetical protein